MRKLWLFGVCAAIIVAAGAVAVVLRATSSDCAKDKKTGVVLEFTPAEVVTPVMVAMPERIEFSGPLMAPRTAVVRVPRKRSWRLRRSAYAKPHSGLAAPSRDLRRCKWQAER
jgi:hypothetical protein